MKIIASDEESSIFGLGNVMKNNNDFNQKFLMKNESLDDLNVSNLECDANDAKSVLSIVRARSSTTFQCS